MTKTQFLIVLAINVFLFGMMFGHIFNEDTKIVKVPQIVTKTVYKDGKQIVKVPVVQTVTKTVPVNVCKASDEVNSYINTATNDCKNQSNMNQNYYMGSFSIDSNGKPRFDCQKQ